MLDACVPARKLTSPRADVIFHANVLAENLTAPAVVITRQPEDFQSAVAELGQRGEGAEARARNDGLPLEPEVEEISIDH